MSNVLEAAARGPGRPKIVAAAAAAATTTTSNTKPVAVDVRLDQHFSARVYTSGSTVAGHATIRCHRPTPFDKVEVTLTGVAATRLDFVQSYSSSAVRHFMKLRMPIPDDGSHLPTSRVLEPGRDYTVPFHFVLPHQLTVNACDHGHTAPAVQDHHLRPPPTLGYWDGDDQAPDMTHVEYAVKARVCGAGGGGGPRSSASILAEGKRIIKVLPSTPEEPPLAVTPKDERYRLSRTKVLRKNLVGPKAGELTVSARQPRAVMLRADGFGASPSAARVSLAWSPAMSSSSDATPPPPPKVNSVSAKLVSTTFFGNTPSETLPNLGPKSNYAENQVLSYSATTPLLSNMRPEGLSWLPSDQRPLNPRRDSGYASGGGGAAASGDEDRSGGRAGGAGGPVLGAHIDVPVHVPVSNKKAFVPTFYNCLVSRTYTLQLVLSVGPANTTMTLNVPLQIGVEGTFDAPDEGPPDFDTAVAQAEEADADAYLRPRTVGGARPRGATALPGYHELVGGHSVAVA